MNASTKESVNNVRVCKDWDSYVTIREETLKSILFFYSLSKSYNTLIELNLKLFYHAFLIN